MDQIGEIDMGFIKFNSRVDKRCGKPCDVVICKVPVNNILDW